MATFRYHKLVRDNIWQWHIEAGHTLTGEQLTGQSLQQAIVDKLHEEAEEVRVASSRSDLIEELADLQQLLDDLSHLHAVSRQDVRAAQQKKRLRKGGFTAGHFIETVTMPSEDDRWVSYCRQAPDKYPEVNKATGRVGSVLPRLELGRYVHTKSGKEYEVAGVGVHTETEEPLVVYAPRYESQYRYFIRPYEMFVGSTEIDGAVRQRFKKASETGQPASGAIEDGHA